MFKLLRKLLSLFFRRKKSEDKNSNRRNSDRKNANTRYTEKEYYASQASAIPYLIAPLLMFGIQGIIATIGATGLVFPDLPHPVSTEMGRAIHLNLSLYWPLIGIMGLTYHFFIKESETELYSRLLARIQFWLLLLTVIGIVFSLAFGFAVGREYREAKFVFELCILFVLTLFVFNLIMTYRKSNADNSRVIPFSMLLGALSLLILDIPNAVSYIHPTTDEMVRFWVVHLWEELSKELLVFGILAAIIMEMAGTRLRSVEKGFLIQSILLIIGATFATGHHYFWIGVPAVWFIIGTFFSIIQVIAIFMVLYIAYAGYKSIKLPRLGAGTRLAMGFFISSIFYHIIGAAVMGMIISIPWVNQYAHGTYLTSAHSHLALFGAIGMLVLGGCTYVFAKKVRFSKSESKAGWLGLIIINAGLLLMSAALIIAGLMQVYQWRINGEDFMNTMAKIRPYLIMRAGGGALFAMGDLLFVFINIRLVWKNRSVMFG